MQSAELVFVPGFGFRPPDGFMLREPVTYEAAGWSVTINRVFADSLGTQVATTIHGPFKWQGDGFKQPDVNYNGLIQARDRSGGLVSSERPGMFPMEHSFSARGTSISCTANMKPLPHLSKQLDILIGEPLPPTVIPIELLAFGDAAIPAHEVDVSDEHHGVTITAHAIARGASMTAVLLHARLLPHPRQRFMRGLGTVRDRPDEPPGVVIRDQSGNRIRPFAATRELAAGPELRTIVVFPGLPAEARSLIVEVPFIVLSEYTRAPVTVTVPSAGEIRLGDDAAFVKVERVNAPRGGSAVAVEFTGSWRDDRRLLYAESLTVGDRYGGVGFRGQLRGEPPIQTYADDPTGESTSVTLESPVLQLRGPWRLLSTVP